MKITVISFLMMSVAVCFVDACGQNAKMYWCRNGIIAEKLCAGVRAQSCQLYTLHCGCGPKLRLNKDHSCVDEKHCRGNIPKKPKIPPRGPTKQDAGVTYLRTLDVMNSRDPLHLVKISSVSWERTDCVCLRSDFVALSDPTFERSFDCYALQDPEEGSELIKDTKSVKFEVKNNDRQVTLHLTSSGGDLFSGLESTYTVLAADETCIVLRIGEDDTGKPYCMLLGLDSDRKKDEKACFFTIEQECVRDTIDVWTSYHDKCDKHDASAVRETENRVKKEQ